MDPSRLSTATRSGRAPGLLVGLILLCAGGVFAADVTVDCDGGPADFGAIGLAVGSLDLSVTNTITVAGTCVEDLFLSGDGFLTVAAAPGDTATLVASGSFSPLFVIDMRQLHLEGLAVDATGADIGLVLLADSNVDFRRGSLSGAEIGALALDGSSLSLGGPDPDDAVRVYQNGAGIWANDSALNLRPYLTIEDNLEDALVVLDDSEVTSAGRDAGGVTMRDNGFGIFVNDSSLNLNGLHEIANNGPYGLVAASDSRVGIGAFSSSEPTPLFFGTTISGHSQWGIFAVSSDVALIASQATAPVHRVTGNGSLPLSNDAGILAIRPSSTRVRFTEVSGNIGPGINARGAAHVNLLGATITGNTGDGLLLEHNSTATLGTFVLADGANVPPAVTISGNGGLAVRCVNDSVLGGPTAGISPIQCGGGSPGPPGGGPPGGGGGPAGPSPSEATRPAVSAGLTVESRGQELRQRLERALARLPD